VESRRTDELDDIFDLVMKGRRGAVCFPLQQLFSALLRFLGFTVSNVRAMPALSDARTQQLAQIHARSNIAVHHRLEGCLWGPATHIILLVQVDDGRLYFCDVGYGGGASTAPVPLEHGARVGALSPSETYELRREVIPNADVDAYHHAVEGMCR
jgi:arylamine N-acetyltransferase